MKKSRWFILVLILAAMAVVVAIFWPKIKECAERRCGVRRPTGTDESAGGATGSAA